jgi:putative transcriptional regulator
VPRSQRLILGSTLLVVVTLIHASSGSSVLAQPVPEAKPSLSKGMFLIASPKLADPNFHHTIVLLCEHGSEGTLGVIINRPTEVLLSEALPDLSVLKGTSYRLFWGGPVQPTGILMLFRVKQTPSGTRSVLDGIYLGGNLQALERVITHPEPTETFRAYAGYAGWAPGQLEFEMTLGSWAIVPADSAIIFDKDPGDLWQDLVESLTRPRVIHHLGPPVSSEALSYSSPSP